MQERYVDKVIIEVKYVSNEREICWQSNNRGKIR